MSPPRRLLFTLALGGALLGAPAGRAQDPHRTPSGGTSPNAVASGPLPTSATEVAAGQELFFAHCASCHGRHGEGGRGPTLAQPQLPRATDDAALVRIIATGLAGTDMPPSKLGAPEIAQVGAFVRSLGRLAPEPVRGDPAAGARLYAEKGNCALCHSVGGRGGALGPDLSAIGLRRGASYLRRALLEPAAEVPQSATPYRSDVSLPENFLFVRVTTRAGRTLAGVRVNEDAFSLQLREPDGRLHSFFKDELAELHKDRGFSPMPAYGAVFTPGELDDVVAYLASLRGPK